VLAPWHGNDMPTTTSPLLQTLAEVNDEDAAAISVYLDLDPSLTATPADIASRVHSAVDRLAAASEQRSGGPKRKFDDGVDRVQRFLGEQDLRGGAEVHGAALFALGSDVFEALPLWRSAGEAITVGRRFALRRLAAEDARTSQVMLVIAGRELGRVVLLRDGRLIELVDADQEIENRHHQGGWAASKLQRYTDRQAVLHLAAVVEIAERVHARVGRPPIVLAGTTESTAVMRGRLGHEASAALIGELPNLRDFGEAGVLHELTALAERHDSERERAMLERHAEQLGRGELAEGLDAALIAISESRVETVLLAPGAEPEVCVCPQCGRLSDHVQVCPLDGSFITLDPTGLEVAVAEAVCRGADVWQVTDANRDALRASAGIGVITRY
jgi:hypothetical protein